MMARARHTYLCAVFALWGIAVPEIANAYCVKTTCDRKTSDCAVDANGCSTEGAPLRWTRMPIPFRFASKGTKRLINEEARQEIRSAFFRWTEVTCNGQRTSLRFVEQELFDGDKPLPRAEPPYKPQAADEPFAIFFRDDKWPNKKTQGETIAQTNTNFIPGNGHIRYVDIEINTADFDFSLSDSVEKSEGKKDIQAVMTHEVGHYIGLDHSAAPLSIMVAGYCEAAQRCSGDVAKSRRLQTDDINAVCALYPPGATYGEETSGCAVSAGDSRAPRWPLVGAFGLVVGAVLLRRRSVRCARRSTSES